MSTRLSRTLTPQLLGVATIVKLPAREPKPTHSQATEQHVTAVAASVAVITAGFTIVVAVAAVIANLVDLAAVAAYLRKGRCFISKAGGGKPLQGQVCPP